MPSLGSYGPVREAKWTRARWFIGHRARVTASGTTVYDAVIFPCRYVPVDSTHGPEFAYVTGPFTTKREAYENV